MSNLVVDIRTAEVGDSVAMANHLRAADLTEIAEGSGRAPVEVLWHGIAGSTLAWTARIDGRIAAIFGVNCVSMLDGIGAPWLIGTDLIDAHPRSLMRESRRYIQCMLDLYPTLRNHVHAENRKAVKWLKRVGFNVMPAIPYGKRGALFHPFELR